MGDERPDGRPWRASRNLDRVSDGAEVPGALRALTKMMADLSAFFLDAFTALNINGISGDYVEFGSAGGTSIRLAHEVVASTPVGRHLWAFDSFAGLPVPASSHDEHPAFRPRVQSGGLDAFVATCDAAGIPSDAYTAIEGYFEETLPHSDPISHRRH